MDGISLPPDLEQFAADEVAAGHYRDAAEVVRAGLDLLRQQRKARAELLASVLEAEAEGDRVGCLTGEEVLTHVRETIARKQKAAS